MQNLMHSEQAIRDREREIQKRIRDRRPQQRRHPSRSVRRAVGRSIMSIGARVAAEPQPQSLLLARSK
jgi:hypothetical protein